ncbi:hypothetical protein [Lacipirellula limnantheis]|uniref:Transposase IS30-like HTH domain-containing protein n=1 Tax=Lacipirellula limnantheis TaxID=2528024 RepID=A0A517TXC7_9BACT|nr:hypothetical protein [Lacipirellula limnantheis]QDT73028.1 hypothetical protein I41_22170 [Lacipirellula limnantheis]
MILENHIRGRRRVLDDAKKARLCELIDQESYTVEQAAESLDVSLRTVQRERRYDQDFDHEVRLALQQSPDPLKLMEHAARSHWRAAAWLLERTKPEEFARKPVNMTSLKLVATAFRYIQEAALETVPAEYHEALYRHTQAAIEQSFDCCFPMRGKWGEPKIKQLPFATPLADVQSSKFWGEPVGVLHDYDEEGNIVFPPPVDPAEVAARQARVAELKQRLAERRRQEALGPRPAAGILSPKTAETTEFNATKSAATISDATEIPSPGDPLAATDSGALPAEPTANNILSPKPPETTTSAATTSSPADGNLELVIAMVERTIDDECPETWNDTEELDHPDAQDPHIRLRLLSERLERHRRQERRQARAAEKKAKAARQRAQAQCRRAA